MSVHDILLRWLTVRARGGIRGLFGDRVLSYSTTRSCTPTSLRLHNGLDLRTARVRINALGVVVFDTLVSRTARSGAADLGRFFDMGSLRAVKIKASSFGSRLLRGCFKGIRRYGTVVLDG